MASEAERKLVERSMDSFQVHKDRLKRNSLVAEESAKASTRSTDAGLGPSSLSEAGADVRSGHFLVRI